MSVFDELLAIKRFREGQAELKVARQRRLQAEADAAREQARQILERYRLEAQQREAAMYDDLCQRVVRVRDIQDVLQDVALLREGERERQTALQKAAERLQQEAEALVQRRDEHQHTVRMTGKFVELARVHLEEHMKMLEQREDLEMEEAASVMRDRGDWEPAEEQDAGPEYEPGEEYEPT